MMTVRVEMTAVMRYVADRPDIFEALKRFVNADNLQDSWRALDDIKKLDEKESA